MNIGGARIGRKRLPTIRSEKREHSPDPVLSYRLGKADFSSWKF